ncbi:OmpA family protein [Segetibacter sp. 3557_3]|uniref:OmpA family protein n=1 Tax=Segetibacter sp. 3557_3 TaxID=2547429 RepID=UPI001058FEFA|nr:OmpA family protein [Segetibacter sp. 3557_3]TDH26814.1 OmpA family protein [Segetibacter sp. 3557_3]
MADLHVQPKKKSILPWILLILGVLALLFFLLRGCNNDNNAAATGDSTVAATTTPDNGANATNTWGDVDFNAPEATYPEITDKNISVRGNDRYSIYGLGENILFDEGKATIRKDAEQNLRQITGSINQRYKGSQLRIYGYTDAVGSAGYNKELSEQRARAVSEWLSSNGEITKDNISLEPVGEARPVASNATSEGRQQNRRVEIVARGNNGGNQ